MMKKILIVFISLFVLMPSMFVSCTTSQPLPAPEPIPAPIQAPEEDLPPEPAPTPPPAPKPIGIRYASSRLFTPLDVSRKAKGDGWDIIEFKVNSYNFDEEVRFAFSSITRFRVIWGEKGWKPVTECSSSKATLMPGTSFNMECMTEAPSGAPEIFLKADDVYKGKVREIGKVKLENIYSPIQPNVQESQQQVEFGYSQPSVSLSFYYENPSETNTKDMNDIFLVLYDQKGFHIIETGEVQINYGTVQLAPYGSSEYQAETIIDLDIWQASHYYFLYYHQKEILIASGTIRE